MSDSLPEQEVLQELRRCNEELTTLVEIGKALTSTLNLQDLLNIIMEKVGVLLKSRNWSLALLDEASGELQFEIAVAPAGELLKGMRLQLGEGIAGWVAARGEALLVPDVTLDRRFSRRIDALVELTTRSVLAVPVKSRNQILGVMELVNGDDDEPFSAADLRILSAIADYAAIAIENARNFEKIHQLTITDDLTGLFNAKHLHHLIDYEMERARRYETDLSLVFIDLDHFKQVNDVFGHLIGSRLLRELGGFIRRSIRRVNLAARYGGDEFVILLPSTSKPGALTMATKLWQGLREQTFLAEEGYQIRITASFGLASFPQDARSKDELLRLADQAMYRVKETSRDGVMTA